jgi:hypothetical protein
MSPSESVPQADNPDEGEVLEPVADGGNDGPIVIANEFTNVVVRKVHTRNGVRLELWSPRRGGCVRFDAVALEALSYQEPEFISDLLRRTPGS